jgi:hypothetical protein
MNREVHVRFWESPEVKVLRATRQSRHFDGGPATSDLPPGTDIASSRRHVSNLPKTELAGMAPRKTVIGSADVA